MPIRELTADAIEWELRPSPSDVMSSSLEDLVVDAVIESQSYRLLAQTAIHHLHDQAQTIARLRAQQSQLTAEYRALRESILRDIGATV